MSRYLLMILPLPADFCLRLAGGLALLLLAVSPRAVPPAFFRNQCQIVLALAVLGALDCGRIPEARPYLYGFILSSIMAYLATLAWGLGLPRLGYPLIVVVVGAALCMMIGISRGPLPFLWVFDSIDRILSGFLLGATLSAMLLGHHYLTAPSMTVDPLRRLIRLIMIGLFLRVSLSLASLCIWIPLGDQRPGLFMMFIRWGMGFGGPLLGAFLSWETVKIRSTQSATGILYITMTLLLFGELTSMILARGGGFAI